VCILCGESMTDKTLEKALQIKKDIKALQDQTINKDVSKELFNSWTEWANSNLDRLKKEYEEL
jgi:ribosomal protein L18E